MSSTTAAVSSISSEPPTSITTTTTAVSGVEPDSYREEWIVATNRGEIRVVGEHTDGTDRWVEVVGPEPGTITYEAVVSGIDAWQRYNEEDWEPTDPAAVLDDLLNGHPFATPTH